MLISEERFRRITSEPDDIPIKEMLEELDREIEETCFRIEAKFTSAFVKLKKRGEITAEQMERALEVLRDIDKVDRKTVENLFKKEDR